MRRVATAALALLVALVAPVAEIPAQSSPANAGTVVSLADHQRRVQVLNDVLLACEAHREQCDPSRVGADETVQAGPGLTTSIRYDWLREGIGQLATLKDAARDELAANLGNRLDLEAATPQAVDAAAVKNARAQIAQVLATREFAPEPPPNWLERKWTEFWRWVGRQLQRTFTAAASGPSWVRILLESLLLLVPVLLLAIWLIRQVREDRRIPHQGTERGAGRELASEEDWMGRAERHAQAGEWRDAIHALYWATIAQYDARKIWPVSRTRTPREYLRLLKAGAAAATPLREQTRLLEATWYGYRSATARDYERAQKLHQELITE